MIMQKENKWDRRIRHLSIASLSCAGILFWVVILNYAFTTDLALNGFYAIMTGALLTIGVVATLPN